MQRNQIPAQLRWVTSEGGDLAGYAVVIRKTTAPDWEREIFVGKKRFDDSLGVVERPFERNVVHVRVGAGRHLQTLHLADRQLEAEVPGMGYNVYVMLHGAVQHATYHAGQIALLKKAA